MNETEVGSFYILTVEQAVSRSNKGVKISVSQSAGQ